LEKLPKLSTNSWNINESTQKKPISAIDFMSQLSKDELKHWMCQFGTSNGDKKSMGSIDFDLLRKCHYFL